VKFSSRFHWDLSPNRLTLALEAKRRAGAPILDLTQSNPTHAGFDYPPDLLRAFADQRTLRYDPSPAGLPEARAAVSAYYAARGISIEPERILLTASTSESYSYLFKLLTDPGAEVLVPRPSYPLFEFLAAMESVAVRSYPLTYYGRWGIDLGGLEAALTAATKAIILVNPNNPTGSYVKKDELAHLTRLASERQIALVSDEVFSDYAFEDDRSRAVTLAGVDKGLAFSMSGLSKIAGLPQMKLGWLITAGAPDNRRLALERLEWIADTYLSVSTPVQRALERLLREGLSLQAQIRERTYQNLQFLKRDLAAGPAVVLDVEGGWYATIQVPRIRTEEEWVLHLLDRWNLLIQPGFFYDFASEAFLVLSLLTEPAVFREGVNRFRECVLLP
jgi:alanine-synthesizing transaminase